MPLGLSLSTFRNDCFHKKILISASLRVPASNNTINDPGPLCVDVHSLIFPIFFSFHLTPSSSTMTSPGQPSSYALGLVFIFVVAMIWSAASIVVQYLYHDQGFDNPLLLTYIGTSLFTVLLPMNMLYQQCEKWRGHNSGTSGSLGSYENLSTEDMDGDVGGTELENTNLPVMEEDPKWTLRDHQIAAAKIAPIWFISNVAYNASLRYTSITSSTVLVNTGSLFTFLFALMIRDENFSYWKLLGVLFGMGGCIITGFNDVTSEDGDGNGRHLLRRLLVREDDDDDHQPNDDNLLWGDVLSVISAVFYGIYAVMVRVLCPRDESRMSMQLFLGYVGLWNMFALMPVVLWEVFVTRSVTITAWVFLCLILKGLFDNVLSDYLWARAVVLTSATVATVGLGLTIPLAFVSDVFMGRHDVLNVESITGALAVLAGFVLVNVGQRKEDEDEHNMASRIQHHASDLQPTMEEALEETALSGVEGAHHRHPPHQSFSIEYQNGPDRHSDDVS
jgi:solute carrier family 35 protein F5